MCTITRVQMNIWKGAVQVLRTQIGGSQKTKGVRHRNLFTRLELSTVTVPFFLHRFYKFQVTPGP